MDKSPVGRLVVGLSAALAMVGGVALAFAMIITTASVIGRALIPFGLSAVPGDVEMVQASILFAVMVFLPWCHLERGHAIVAVLTDKFPVRFSAVSEFVWDVVMVAAVGFLTWRLWFGLLDKFKNGESTFILRMPIWITFAGGMIGATVFVIVAIYCAVRSARNAFSAHPVAPLGGGGE